MASKGLRYRTIKSYMAGIRHLHIKEDLADPFLPTLPYVLRGMKQSQGEGGAFAHIIAPGQSCLERSGK